MNQNPLQRLFKKPKVISGAELTTKIARIAKQILKTEEESVQAEIQDGRFHKRKEKKTCQEKLMSRSFWSPASQLISS